VKVDNWRWEESANRKESDGIREKDRAIRRDQINSNHSISPHPNPPPRGGRAREGVAMSEKMIKEGTSKRIGLFGGTFNPIHLGHLRGAEEIREAFHLEEVTLIPSSIPPHKVTENVIEARHRLEMVRLATANNRYFSTSDIELSRPGKSYSIDTLRYFRGRQRTAFFLILGRDAFVEIETWKEFQNLFSLCHVIVMTRPASQKNTLSLSLPEALVPNFRYSPEEKAWIHLSGYFLYFKEISFLDISSTKVRELIEKGESVRYLIPAEVEAYIQKHGLYRRSL
jgi:nicotinate-nucleotide adenylyltransferase